MKQPATRKPIQANSVYALDDFMERDGLTRQGIRAARRAGLRVRYAHGRAFVLGGDWYEYLCKVGKSTKDEARREA